MKRIQFALLLLVLASTAFSDPRQWDNSGVPVRAVSVIEDFSSTTRTDGATLVVWAESRGFEPVVVGQLLSPAGLPLWVEGGLELAHGSRRAGYPIVQSVGGEWVILWQDAEITASSDPNRGWNGRGSLRLIRIDDNGNPVWGGGGEGLELAPLTDWWDVQPCGLFKSGTGVIATWRDYNAHWAMRISENGQFDWPLPVVIPARHSTRLPAVVEDELGGLVFVWSQILAEDTVVQVNRLQQDGTFAWNDTLGVTVYASGQYFHDVAVCADHAGGAYVIWRGSEDGNAPRAQHINAQGELQWDSGGVLLATLTTYGEIVKIAPSFLNGQPNGLLTVLREDDWQTEIRMLAQKVGLDGNKPWGDDGVTLCSRNPNDGHLWEAGMISDEAGGALCLMEKSNYDANGSAELLLSRVNADGDLSWGETCEVTAIPPQPNSDMKFTTPTLHGNAVQVLALNANYMYQREIQQQRLSLATGEWQLASPRTLATGDPAGVRELSMTRLSNGSTVSSWQAYNSSYPAVYYQIMDVFGSPMLQAEGALLAHDDAGTPLYSTDCELGQDGSGGFFAVYRAVEDGRFLLRAAHVNGLGQHLSDPAGELVMDTTDWIEAYHALSIPDGNGGSYVVAAMYDQNFYVNTVVMRIDAHCRPLWNESVVFSSVNQDVNFSSVILGEDNSCLVLYKPYQFHDSELHLARITDDGETHWNIVVDSSVYNSYYDGELACANAAGGAYVIWSTMDDAEEVFQLRVQNISASGEFLWGDEGVVFEDPDEAARDFSCDVDVVGNLTFAWEQYNATDLDLLAQRISPSGDVMWPDSGLAISMGTGNQYDVTTVTISDNEVYFVWSDDRQIPNPMFWTVDIYATHVNAAGQIRDDSYWVAGGNPICENFYPQSDPVAVADGAGGIAVAWFDQRTVTSMEQSIFAQRLYDPIFTDADETPGLVTEYSLSQNYPNPFNPTTAIEFALPYSGHTSLVVYDVTGREVTRLLDQPMAVGTHRLTFEAHSLASGIYFYSLRSADFAETRKMVLLR
ncbi:T9SS type A sorting domain-containing protein [bacterium]|nr:T9SS type A sorting domain-containing protein [bacterium]